MPSDLIPLRTVVLDHLRDVGVDVALVLRRARLFPSRFEAGKAALTTGEFFAFWNALEELTPGSDIGIRLGSETLRYRLDLASLVALHSRNLGEGLKKFARYKALCLSEQVEIDVDAGEVRIAFRWVHGHEKAPMLLVDGAFASVLAVIRAGTAREVAPLRVELARRRPQSDHLQRYFKCEVIFDAAFDVLVLDAGLLDEPFVTANEDLVEIMLPGLDAALNERLSHSFIDDVKTELRRQMSGRRPSIDRVAAAMRLSVRTLQRRLGEAGTTYQSLLDDERRLTARRLLNNTDLDASEIAFLLGFEEPNSFSRAFYGWEGMTPARWGATRVRS